ncbi:heat-inducible transcription repressor HrcA [bacterium]|nr:heat-inducible transcription repressor HrcA [bacterium]
MLNHIETATPVGSAHLVNKSGIECSAATIRNEMTLLEEMEYIEQPHTSAGRVPTDKGYRYYVDNLMKRAAIPEETQQEVYKRMESARGNVKQILEEASRILGVISSELGVVLTPWLAWGVFDRLELIELSHNKVLAVIHVRSRLVKTVVVELTSPLSQEQLQRTAAVINERLSGLSLEEINTSIHQRLKSAEEIDRALLQVLTERVGDFFDFSEPLDIHTSGTRNIISKPEFADSTRMSFFFTLIDDRKQLMRLFSSRESSTRVAIGKENGDQRLGPFSVISSYYTRGRDIGSLGIIGPKRMSYRKVLPLVETMSRTMSRFLS